MRVTVARSDRVSAGAAPVLAAVRAAALGPLLRRCGDALGVPERSALTLRVADDVELAELNARYLGTPEATDVLAFPAEEAGYVGDIVISAERALRQAPDGDGPAELRLLAVHGLLHCLGHDHGDADGAARMTALTRELLPDQTVPDLVPAA